CHLRLAPRPRAIAPEAFGCLGLQVCSFSQGLSFGQSGIGLAGRQNRELQLRATRLLCFPSKTCRGIHLRSTLPMASQTRSSLNWPNFTGCVSSLVLRSCNTRAYGSAFQTSLAT